MSGAGHVQDMNNRIRQNRSLRPSKRPKFKENNRETIYSSKEGKALSSNFKILPEKELIDIKNKISKRAREDQRKKRDFMIILVVIALLISTMVLWYIKSLT